MKIVTLVVVLVYLISVCEAGCGCLKCSKHLQSVDVTGGVKVIFPRPKEVTTTCPPRDLNNNDLKVEYPCKKPTIPLLTNLKYVTDRVVLTQPPCHYSSSLTPQEVLQWVKSQCVHCPGRCKRDLGDRSYNLFMKMLPPSIREPLHHSIRGASVVSPNKFDWRTWTAKPKKLETRQRDVNEAMLLKKLRKLNGNFQSSDLEAQSTAFMKSLLKPTKSRTKRTIVVGSDEIDLPTHYKVDIVSHEDESGEPFSEEPLSEEPLSEEQPRFMSKFSPKSLFPTPDVIVGKHVIKKAVREELDAYHKKQAAKLPLIPQNPIFLLLTAPMQFLKHLSNVNTRGVNPVMTTIPKVIHTAKKCFKDLGKNFHKHCLNVASNIIGDFDHVQPSVIDHLARYKRDINENFRLAPEDHVRKKRYVIKVVDDDEVHSQLKEYLTDMMDDRFSFLKPLQEYHSKISDFFSNWYSDDKEAEEDEPKKKTKIQIRKVKPKVIIDNKGFPFMEYDGFKRPLLFNNRKKLQKEDRAFSAEEDDKISSLIARFKKDSEMVGNVQKEKMPKKVIKERISSLLKEIDQLVHLNAEDYDHIFETLLQVQQVKASIENDWKRLLIDGKVDDFKAKIGLLSKFKDLQNARDESVNSISKELEKNDNEFVRKQLVHSLIKLQKLQCLITNVVEDFEQHLKTKTFFSEKKEVRYVDFLGELKFVHAKTRNDLVKKLGRDRDVQGQKDIEIVNKLKKISVTLDENSDKFQKIAKLVWEIKNLQSLQLQTIKDMNRRLKRKINVRKEMKIIFDLQKRFEDCEKELEEALGGFAGKAEVKLPSQRRDVKEMVAEWKKKHEEMMRRAREKSRIDF